ncbi:MAG: nucleotidyltransferase family protein [Sphingobacteriales bacterium]|nr:MAG: nucleotidyltransferase family protein [Sphingobacteriales bacterium]
MSVSAIVLAAGLSSRMGPQNKLLLPFGKQPMVRVVVTQLLAAGLQEVIVVTGHQEAEVRDALKGLPIRWVHNTNYQSGMTSSIQAGVAVAGGTGYLIGLADMPLLRAENYTGLVNAFEQAYREDIACMIAAARDGRQRNPVIFSSHYREGILNHTFPEGCKELVLQHASHLRLLHIPEPQALKDFDTPEAYQNQVQDDD